MPFRQESQRKLRWLFNALNFLIADYDRGHELEARLTMDNFTTFGELSVRQKQG